MANILEIEKNRDLIRLEMNIVEYPIFSKNKNIKEENIIPINNKEEKNTDK